MLKLIRVILSMEVLGFVAGINQARQLLGSFLNTIKSVMAGAAKLVGGLAKSFMDLPHLLDGAFEKIENFFGPALSRERGEAIFRSLTGSAEQAADMMGFLRDASLNYGKSLEEILPSAQQIAVALRGANGEVDPAKWEQLTMAIVKFSTLRPDVPIQLWGRAISGLLSGDVSTLTRLLDIDVKSMGQLSDKVKAFLSDANTAREEQLGSVTRLGGQAVSDQETALQALEEIMDAVGATDDLLEETTNTTQGKLDRLKAQWEDFVARVGEELLPILIEALDKLLQWITDHEDEIEAFLKGLGKEAMEAWNALKDFDWKKLGDDIAAAGQTGKEAWEWLQELNEALQPIADALSAISAFSQNAGKDTGAALGTDQFGPWLRQQLGLEPKTAPIIPAMSDDFVSTEPLYSSQPAASAPTRVDIHITHSVDESGNLKPVVERISQAQTAQAIDDLVTAATKQKGQSGASIS